VRNQLATTVSINLESVFFVKVTCKYGERNVNDDEGKDRCPNCNVVDQLLSKVVEDSRKVDGIDRRNEPGSETTKQVTAEPHTLWSCRFNLVKRYFSGLQPFLLTGSNKHFLTQSRTQTRRRSQPASFYHVSL